MPIETASPAPWPGAAALLQGFGLMAGLIVAIGAQNALVLRQGLARRHVAAVVLFCTLSDWVLTAAGIFGFGHWIGQRPLLLQALRVGGAAFLAVYAARCAWSAWHDGARRLGPAQGGGGLAATLGSAAAMTWLNPHVYLDTVVLVGLVGTRHPAPGQWFFAGGAALASALWFAVLGFGAAQAAPLLQRPGFWRGVDLAVAVLMATLAVQLLLAPGRVPAP